MLHAVPTETDLDQLVLRLIAFGVPKAGWQFLHSNSSLDSLPSRHLSSSWCSCSTMGVCLNVPRWDCVVNVKVSRFLPLCLRKAFQAIEFFCCDMNVTKSLRWGRIAAAALDIKFGEGKRKGRRSIYRVNPFDLATPVGFAFFGCISAVISSLPVPASSLRIGALQVVHLGHSKWRPQWLLHVDGVRVQHVQCYERRHFKAQCCNTFRR